MAESDMMYVEMEYDEEGVLKPEHLEELSLEQIQEVIDVINQAMRLDERNLEILRKARDEKVFTKMAELKVDSFDEGSHTYTKMPKSEISGELLARQHPVMWTEITSKFRSMVKISSKDMDKYLKAKGANPTQRESVLKDIKVPLGTGVKVTKR